MRKKGLRRLWTGMLLLGMAVFSFTFTPVKAEEAEVVINESTFPDRVFREYVSSKFDTDKNGSLSQNEITAVTEINIECDGDKDKTASLKGIEYFSELSKLDCDKNKLTDLDVRENTQLTYLSCKQNQLKNLDVSKNSKLQILYFYGNQISGIDLSRNTELLLLSCGGNKLTKLDLSRNTELTSLHCYQNQLESLEVSNLKRLTTLECFNNQLTSLDISGDTALKELSCYGNSLTSLDTSNNKALIRLVCRENQIKELKLSSNTELEELYCENNNLTSLDISNNTEILELACNSNKLTALKLGNNKKLNYLSCSYNRLTSLYIGENTALDNLIINDNSIGSLNLSRNYALTTLYCDNNKLTSLDTGANTKLLYLSCSNNQLTSLDVSKNSELFMLYCDANQISGLDLGENKKLSMLSVENNPIMILNVTDTFSDRTLTSKIDLINKVQMDLSKCAGWDADKISNITGAKLVGDILEFDTGANEVSYSYDCGYNCILNVQFDIRLYEFKIEYQLNGGINAEMNPATYYPSLNEIILENPEREGYAFDGWYEDAEFKSRITAIPKGHVGDVRLYAKWTKLPDSDPKPTPAPEPAPDDPSKNPNQGTTVTPSKEVKAKIVKITAITKKVAPGKRLTLKATVTPKKAKNKKVKWTIRKSDKKYASINGRGVLTVKKTAKGKTIKVTATAAGNSRVKAVYTVKVMKKAVKRVMITSKKNTVKKVTVRKKQSVTLKAKLTPTKGISKEVTWISSNPKIARVTAKGKVTGKKKGTVKITAKAKDGSGEKATITIQVK